MSEKALLPIHTLETAPEETKETIEAIQKTRGFVPNLIGVLANSPQILEAYKTMGAINQKNSLTPTEREVVQITAAVTNGCGFCVAGHTELSLKRIRMSEELVEALRQRTPIAEPKLDLLAKFTVAVMEGKGNVGEQALAEFLAAGYTHQNALDVVLGVALASICNYSNNLAQTPINLELQPYALKK